MADPQDNPSGALPDPAAWLQARRLRAAWVGIAEAERRRLACWAPVAMGFGVWLYFVWPQEPSAWLLAAVVATPAAALPLLLMPRPAVASVLLAALALACAGFAAAGVSARLSAAPVLPAPVDATVEGRVAEVSRSANDRRRVELDDVVIYGLAAAETPARVRVTLLEGAFSREVAPGERIAVFARLSPPGGPVEPGGFDFRRHAWFQRLGGVGYALGPLVASQSGGSGGGPAASVERLRGRMTAGILEALPGREGGFAAAILTGSRAEIRAPELQALRDSNLAHLLAISGLHMGLLAGLVFGAARLGLAATPGAAVRLPAKKIAAGVALAAAAAYLLLSGASVATQRAFVMAAAALLAVMIDRPAISMRALAAAALIILLIRPESLLDAGFQMSFAATAALVAVYEWVSRAGMLRQARAPWPRRVGLYVAGLALTSLVAGLATAPYAAAAFNRAASYGLLANLAAAPVMAFWVAPMGALAGALAPLGLHELPLQAMGWGIAAILRIAEGTAALPGAVRAVVQPPEWALPLVTLGGLWLLLWRSRLRAAGLAPLAVGVGLWMGGGARPEALVAPDAAALGVLGPEGRAVDRARGAGYAISTWLAGDGDLATQREAAARVGLERGRDGVGAHLSNGWRVQVLEGRAEDGALARACAERTVLIVPEAQGGAGKGSCLLLDRARLAALGAVAVEPLQDGVQVRGALEDARHRIWATAPRAASGGG